MIHAILQHIIHIYFETNKAYDKEKTKPSTWSLYDQNTESFDILHTASRGLEPRDTDTRNSDFPTNDRFIIDCKMEQGHVIEKGERGGENYKY